MRHSDFIQIYNFTYDEVLQHVKSKTDMDRLSYGLIRGLDLTRSYIGHPFILLDINKGRHGPNSQHDRLNAVDFYIKGVADPLDVVMHLVKVGYTGIGVYKNEDNIYSYHADIRPSTGRVSKWSGTKEPNNNIEWTYGPLNLNI